MWWGLEVLVDVSAGCMDVGECLCVGVLRACVRVGECVCVGCMHLCGCVCVGFVRLGGCVSVNMCLGTFRCVWVCLGALGGVCGCVHTYCR